MIGWSSLQPTITTTALYSLLPWGRGFTLKSEYLEALRSLQWRQNQDQPLCSLELFKRRHQKSKLTICMFTCFLRQNTWFAISVKIFWWTLQGKQGYDIFNFMFELNSWAKPSTLTLGIRKPCLHFISGWFWATWEGKFYKIEIRLLSTFTVGELAGEGWFSTQFIK